MEKIPPHDMARVQDSVNRQMETLAICLQDVETVADPSITPELVQRSYKDPYGLSHGAPLVFAAYKVAVDCYPKLVDRILDEQAVTQRLRKLSHQSAFQNDYVTRQVFKLINPYGHGANSSRFSNETLAWFRQTYSDDAYLTSGFIMLLCTARWWILEQGQRSITPGVSPLTTSDLDSKLKSFGFLFGERQAVCRMMRREPRQQ